VLKLWSSKIDRGYFTMNALKSADEIFMTNTGSILAPVTEVKPLGIQCAPGRHTKALRALLDKEILGAKRKA
jgi:branched-subunit amino acid aminotransferase/4-amino-4-deoxychorismate lyase